MTEATRANQVWGVVTAHAGALDVPVSLRSLCQAAAARLPVSGVAVSVRSGRVVSEVLCAIGPLSRELEELQLTVGEGPSLKVLTGSPSVLVGDLDSSPADDVCPERSSSSPTPWSPTSTWSSSCTCWWIVAWSSSTCRRPGCCWATPTTGCR